MEPVIHLILQTGPIPKYIRRAAPVFTWTAMTYSGIMLIVPLNIMLFVK